MVDAFVQLKRTPGTEHVKLRAAGWLGDHNKAYAEENFEKLRAAGLADSFEYVGQVTREEKIEFLQSIDLLCVPTEFLEPKALYTLEAMAIGIPVVEPSHGCFPELVESTGGGLLYEPGNQADLQAKLLTLVKDHEQRRRLGQQGQASVVRDRSAKAMATQLGSLLFNASSA